MNSIDNKISLISLVTFLSYVSFLSYKFGECVFYGYPMELIWTDTNNLISILVQNSVMIISCFTLIYISYKRKTSLIGNVFIIGCGILTPIIFDYHRFLNEWQGTILVFILFVIIFSISSCLKKSFKNDNKFLNTWNVCALALFCMVSALIGNLSPTLSRVFIDSNQNIVAGNFKDYAIKVSCDSFKKKTTRLTSYENVEANIMENNILERNWFSGECKQVPLPIILYQNYI